MRNKQDRPQHGFSEQLVQKSRHRRQTLERLSMASSSHSVRRNDLSPPLRLEVIPVSEVRSPPRSVRRKTATHIREIASSMHALGYCRPILIGRNNVIIDGESTLEAARQLGLRVISVIRVEHLTEVEQRTLRLTINRLGEKGEWDLDELKLEFSELLIEDAPLEISGFSSDEIDHAIQEDVEGLERGALEPDGERSPVARIGDIFQLGPHRVICGDATKLDVYEELMSNSILSLARLVITDEPYNVPIAGHVSSMKHREFPMASGEMSDSVFSGFNTDWMGCSLKYLCDGGVLGSFIDWRGNPIVHSAAVSLGLKPLNLIVWGKTNAGMGSLYRSQHELLPLFKWGTTSHVNNIELGRRGRYRSNLWTYAGASSLGSDARRGLTFHPTVKPTAMLEDLLLDLSDRGELVLDPFLGSGSTLIAADRVGRICYGIELDPLYVDVIVRRFEHVTGRMAKLLATGQSFADLASARMTG